MFTRSSQVVIPAALLVASPLAAQYQHTVGDTLHYEEQTHSTVNMETPGGPMTLRSSHQATIGVAFGPGDTATGWYEALRLEQETPGGPQQPSTDALLDQPFELSFDDRGRVSTRSAPGIPPEIRSMSDLGRQFDDFFISLPEDNLAVGTEWSDTIVSGPVQGGGPGTIQSRRMRSYRVERDTVVGGVRGIVIRVDQTIGVQASGPTPGQDFTAETDLRGTESGIAVFLPAEGVLYARRRSGRLDGMTLVTGAGGEFQIPQAIQYESSLTLRR